MEKNSQYQGFEGGGPMIRIGSVEETQRDLREESSPLWVPRPRAAVESGSAVHPPAA